MASSSRRHGQVQKVPRSMEAHKAVIVNYCTTINPNWTYDSLIDYMRHEHGFTKSSVLNIDGRVFVGANTL